MMARPKQENDAQMIINYGMWNAFEIIKRTPRQHMLSYRRSVWKAEAYNETACARDLAVFDFDHLNDKD